MEVLTGEALSVWLEFIAETSEKVFCLQMQIKSLLFLADIFINKLKTNFLEKIFYRTVSNAKRIHNSFWRNFLPRAKQMPSKVLFVWKKMWWPFGDCTPKL